MFWAKRHLKLIKRRPLYFPFGPRACHQPKSHRFNQGANQPLTKASHDIIHITGNNFICSNISDWKTLSLRPDFKGYSSMMLQGWTEFLFGCGCNFLPETSAIYTSLLGTDGFAGFQRYTWHWRVWRPGWTLQPCHGEEVRHRAWQRSYSKQGHSCLLQVEDNIQGDFRRDSWGSPWHWCKTKSHGKATCLGTGALQKGAQTSWHTHWVKLEISHWALSSFGDRAAYLISEQGQLPMHQFVHGSAGKKAQNFESSRSDKHGLPPPKILGAFITQFGLLQKWNHYVSSDCPKAYEQWYN